MVMVGEAEHNVRDILAESGGDPAARAERDEAAAWLDVIKAVRADEIAEAMLN